MKVGVTGATGMVGRYFMRELRARGETPVGIVRSPNKEPSLKAQGFAMRSANLNDKAALITAFEGLDAVVANAALIAVGGQKTEVVLNNNIEGTRNVFAAMAVCGIKRAVMTSSATAYRGGGYRSVIDETWRLRSLQDTTHRFNCYAQSKAAAEDVAREISAKHGIALSIARPHQIYGAFDQNGFTAYLRMLMAPRFLSLWVTHWYFPSVYAGDLVDAMYRMLVTDAAIGESMNICGEPFRDSYWDHIKAWEQAGMRVPKLVLPVPFPIKRGFSIEKAKKLLGWSPRPLAEGFADLVRFEADTAAFFATPRKAA